MITIEETRDVEWLDSIARRPDVYEPMIWDGGVSRETISVRGAINNWNIFFKVLLNGRPVGFFMAEWKEDGRYEIHTNLTVECRGKDALEAGRMVRDELFGQRSARMLTSTCPGYNPQALVFAMRCGMKVDYRRDNEFVKHGKSYRGTHVILTRPEWTQMKGSLCHSQQQ